jgi:hypothetical protein
MRTRHRSLAIATAAIALSATTVAAFSALPDAAWNGLTKAQDASGQTLPQRPATLPNGADTLTTSTADLPDAASHGADVSSVATSEDTTSDTNHGADVSAVAKDNHGQSVAADAGAPDGAGRPEGAGQPEEPGQPADPGAPDGAGKPEGLPTRP